MKNKIYIAIICAFSIVFAVSSGFLIKHYCDSAKQAEMYDNLIEVVETEPEETTELMNYSEEKTFIPEYQELYLQNNDMVGWIKVEDTKINYPVMQSKDNPNFYLKHGIVQTDLGVQQTTLGIQYVHVADDTVDVLQLGEFQIFTGGGFQIHAGSTDLLHLADGHDSVVHLLESA